MVDIMKIYILKVIMISSSKIAQYNFWAISTNKILMIICFRRIVSRWNFVTRALQNLSDSNFEEKKKWEREKKIFFKFWIRQLFHGQGSISSSLGMLLIISFSLSHTPNTRALSFSLYLSHTILLYLDRYVYHTSLSHLPNAINLSP